MHGPSLTESWYVDRGIVIEFPFDTLQAAILAEKP